MPCRSQHPVQLLNSATVVQKQTDPKEGLGPAALPEKVTHRIRQRLGPPATVEHSGTNKISNELEVRQEPVHSR